MQSMAIESEADTHARRRLQRQWWKQLVAHPLAGLHRHMAPGELAMFGISDNDQACLIAPGVSLHYLVWDNQYEVSASINDRADPQPVYPLALRDPNKLERDIYARLVANKDDIDARFGDHLYWCESGLINFYADGGYASPEQEWNEIISCQVKAMNRLYAALLPHVDG